MVLILVISIIEILSIIFLFTYKKYTYKKINGIVVKDNLVSMILNSEEKKLIYSNKKVYLNDKLVKYEIKEDRGKVLKRSGNNYYELLVNIHFSKDKKVNEVLELSINNKKKTIIKILKEVWDGD